MSSERMEELWEEEAVKGSLPGMTQLLHSRTPSCYGYLQETCARPGLSAFQREGGRG